MNAAYWFDRCVQRDPIGQRVHEVFAWLTIAVMPLGTTPLAIMTAILTVYAVLRAWATIDTCRLWWREPFVWLLATWLAWMALSLAWSQSRSQGLDELAAMRLHLPMLFALWPVVRRSHLWFTALGIGVAMTSCVQLLQRFAPGLVPGELWWHAEQISGRYPGLLHPSQTSLLAAFVIFTALGSVCATNQTRVQRVLGVCFITAGSLSLFLTASRAAMLAAALTLPIAALSIALHRRRSRNKASTSSQHRDNRFTISLWILLAMAMIVAIIMARPAADRFDQAWQGVRQAIVHEDYTNDVAARWRQAQISFALASQHPFTGVGAGDYHSAATAWLDQQTNPESETNTNQRAGLLPHPHSSLLYALAVLGLPGLICFLAIWCTLAWRAAQRIHFDVEHSSETERYDPVLLPAVLMLFIAFVLDAHILSSPGVLLMTMLIAHMMRLRFLPPHGLPEAGS